MRGGRGRSRGRGGQRNYNRDDTDGSNQNTRGQQPNFSGDDQTQNFSKSQENYNGSGPPGSQGRYTNNNRNGQNQYNGRGRNQQNMNEQDNFNRDDQNQYNRRGQNYQNVDGIDEGRRDGQNYQNKPGAAGGTKKGKFGKNAKNEQNEQDQVQANKMSERELLKNMNVFSDYLTERKNEANHNHPTDLSVIQPICIHESQADHYGFILSFFESSYNKKPLSNFYTCNSIFSITMEMEYGDDCINDYHPFSTNSLLNRDKRRYSPAEISKFFYQVFPDGFICSVDSIEDIYLTPTLYCVILHGGFKGILNYVYGFDRTLILSKSYDEMSFSVLNDNIHIRKLC